MQFFIHSLINTQEPMFQVIEQKLLREGLNLENIEDFPCYKRLHVAQAARHGSFIIGRIRFDDARILVMSQGQKCYVMDVFWDHRYERAWLLKMLQSPNAPEWIREFETLLNKEVGTCSNEDQLPAGAATPLADFNDEAALSGLVSSGNFSRLLLLSATQAEIQSLIQRESADIVSTVLSLAGHGKTVLAKQILIDELAEKHSVVYIAPNAALTREMKQTLKTAGYRCTRVDGSYCADDEERPKSFHDIKTRFACETAIDFVYHIAQFFEETQLLTHHRVEGKIQRKDALTPICLDNYLQEHPLTGFDSGLIHYEIIAVILGLGLDKEFYLKEEQSSLASREERQRMFQYAQQFLDAYKTHLNVYDLARRLILLYQSEHLVMSDTSLLVVDEVHNIPPVFLELFRQVFNDIPDKQRIKHVLLGDPYQMHHPLYTRVDKQIQAIYGDQCVKFYELSQNWRVPKAIFSGLYHLLSLDNMAFGHRGDIKYKLAPVCMQSEEGRICHTLEPLNGDLLTKILKSIPEIGFFTSDNALRNELKQRGCIHVYGPGEYQGLTFKTVILGDSFSVLNSREMTELLRLYQERSSRLNADSCFHYQRPTHDLLLRRTHRYALRHLALGVSRATDTVILMHKQLCLPSTVLPLDLGLDGVALPDEWLLSAQKCLKKGNVKGAKEILQSESLWGDVTLLSHACQWLNLLLVEKNEDWQQRCLEQILSNPTFTALFAAATANPLEQRLSWLMEQCAVKQKPVSPRFFQEQSASKFELPPADSTAKKTDKDSSNHIKHAVISLDLDPLKAPQSDKVTPSEAVAATPTIPQLSSSLSPKQQVYIEQFAEMLMKRNPKLLIVDFWKHGKIYHFLMTHKLSIGQTLWDFLADLGHSQYLHDLLKPVFADITLTERFHQVLIQAFTDDSLDKPYSSITLMMKLITECQHRKTNVIDITGIDKAELIAALYNASKTVGNSFLGKKILHMTPEHAQKYVNLKRLDYLEGHLMKIDISQPMMSYEAYETAAGSGTVWAIVTNLRQQTLDKDKGWASSLRI